MIKVISLNVRGLSNFKKRRVISNWCRKMNSDINLLQEIHSKLEIEKQWEHEWGKCYSRTAQVCIRTSLKLKETFTKAILYLHILSL